MLTRPHVKLLKPLKVILMDTHKDICSYRSSFGAEILKAGEIVSGLTGCGGTVGEKKKSISVTNIQWSKLSWIQLKFGQNCFTSESNVYKNMIIPTTKDLCKQQFISLHDWHSKKRGMLAVFVDYSEPFDVAIWWGSLQTKFRCCNLLPSLQRLQFVYFIIWYPLTFNIKTLPRNILNLSS